MKDYTGKIIYMGIDVHKKTFAVTAICEKEIVKRAAILILESSFPRRRESSLIFALWMPAFAGMTSFVSQNES
jgi:hypothetical protein